VDKIKHWLRTEPARGRSPNRVVRELRILFVDLDRSSTSSCCCRICHELRVAALLHAHEPEHRCFNRLADSQNAVVLQQSRLVVSNGFGDVLAFFRREHDAVEAVINDVILRDCKHLCSNTKNPSELTL
jgi:hypothetical protein